MKCPVSGAKMLTAIKNDVTPALNPSLNLTDSVNKSTHEIKSHLMKKSCCFSLSFIVTCVSQNLYPNTKCSAVPGALPRKFTLTEKLDI